MIDGEPWFVAAVVYCASHPGITHTGYLDVWKSGLLWIAASWLGDLDSNQGCPGQSREFYR